MTTLAYVDWLGIDIANAPRKAVLNAGIAVVPRTVTVTIGAATRVSRLARLIEIAHDDVDEPVTREELGALWEASPSQAQRPAAAAVLRDLAGLDYDAIAARLHTSDPRRDVSHGRGDLYSIGAWPWAHFPRGHRFLSGWRADCRAQLPLEGWCEALTVPRPPLRAVSATRSTEDVLRSLDLAVRAQRAIEDGKLPPGTTDQVLERLFGPQAAT